MNIVKKYVISILQIFIFLPIILFGFSDYCVAYPDEFEKTVDDLLNNRLTMLDFRFTNFTNIGTEGVRYLADALRVNTTLIILNFGFNHIDDEGVRYLADALRVNTALISLDLGINHIDDEGVRYLADALRVNTVLTKLNLGCHDIKAAGIRYLADALRVNTGLTDFVISASYWGSNSRHVCIKYLVESFIYNTFITYVKIYSLDTSKIYYGGIYEELIKLTVERNLLLNQLVPALRASTSLDLYKGFKASHEAAVSIMPPEIVRRIVSFCEDNNISRNDILRMIMDGTIREFKFLNQTEKQNIDRIRELQTQIITRARRVHISVDDRMIEAFERGIPVSASFGASAASFVARGVRGISNVATSLWSAAGNRLDVVSLSEADTAAAAAAYPRPNAATAVADTSNASASVSDSISDPAASLEISAAAPSAVASPGPDFEHSDSTAGNEDGESAAGTQAGPGHIDGANVFGYDSNYYFDGSGCNEYDPFQIEQQDDSSDKKEDERYSKDEHRLLVLLNKLIAGDNQDLVDYNEAMAEIDGILARNSNIKKKEIMLLLASSGLDRTAKVNIDEPLLEKPDFETSSVVGLFGPELEMATYQMLPIAAPDFQFGF